MECECKGMWKQSCRSVIDILYQNYTRGNEENPKKYQLFSFVADIQVVAPAVFKFEALLL